MDAGLTLQQLMDYAFSNRVVFFNALDKEQVRLSHCPLHI